MTRIIITALAEDVAEYNRNMSKLSAAFKPLAAKFGGEEGMLPGEDPQKPVLTFTFKDAASVEVFLAEGSKVATARAWSIRKLPALTMRQE